MRIVHGGVRPLHTRIRGQIALVARGGILVHLKHIFVPAEAQIDVRGHVQEVSRIWRRASQPVGVGFGALWPVRGFHEVDIIVDRGDMVGNCREGALKQSQGLRGVLLGVRPS